MLLFAILTNIISDYQHPIYYMSIKADLKQVIYALSDALDLVGIDDVAHGKRVGIMAAECSKILGYTEEETNFVFDFGMLHDIGVSSTKTHKHLVEEFDWEGSQTHAESGYLLLANFAPLARMALPIRYHHTRWDKLLTLDITPELAQQANLIFLVDRVDALSAPFYVGNGAIFHKEEIRKKIIAQSGKYFAPNLVEAFLETSRTEAFWLLLEPRSIQLYLQDQMSRHHSYSASISELKQLAQIFSHIVDTKSPFTAEHSLGVSKLSRFLAEKMSLSPEICDQIEIAGLLHDLGKLRIPDEVLDKPAKLDVNERLVINTHTFETFQILNSITDFEELARWAAYHHEEPDGSGYPFHLKDHEMPFEAKIIRVADIFQALAQNRPYRKGLSTSEVIAVLASFASDKRIDAEIFATVERWQDDAMRAAVS